MAMAPRNLRQGVDNYCHPWFNEPMNTATTTRSNICPLCGGATIYGECPSGVCMETLAAAGDENARREVNRSNALNGYAPRTW